jgi:transposase-like protein
MTTLTQEQYQQKIADLKSPGEIAAFVKEYTISEDENIVVKRGRPRKFIDLPAPSSNESWKELAGNDLEEKAIALYAKGLTTRDIMNYIKEHHNVEISQTMISNITDKVYPLIKEWQSRPLASVYAFVYLDGLRFKVRDGGKIVNKCAYIALGISGQGQKEVLGIWIAETESAKFWMGILNELKNRGVDDVLIACVDGLRGFSEAIKAIYPDAEIQQCIVHQIRHTVKFMPNKDRELFCEDLKTIYAAPTEEAGREALEKVKEKWPRYQPYLKSWDDKWSELAPFFAYPEAIRKAMYTTNAIESLNHQFRKVTKTTMVFPHDESLEKLLWLAQDDIAKGWSKPVRNWGEIITQLIILFPDKLEL